VPRKPSKVTLHPEDPLEDSPRQTTSMSLPLAVHHRLDVIAERAARTRPTRAEIIGMLIAEAELDPRELERRIMDYRALTVGQVVPEEPADNVYELTPRVPGRPRGRAS
jgi:hypothetical protein